MDVSEVAAAFASLMATLPDMESGFVKFSGIFAAFTGRDESLTACEETEIDLLVEGLGIAGCDGIIA